MILMSIKIDRQNNEIISKDIKEVENTKEDKFLNSLAQILGDEFLKRRKANVI